jgi:hypothetical protein
MSRKFNFKTVQENQLTFNPEPQIYKFYQICGFKNPWTNKYSVRKCLINENGVILESSVKKYSTDKYNALIKNCKQNEHKVYNTFDIELIDLPNGEDISGTRSELLNNTQSYTGFAPF